MTDEPSSVTIPRPHGNTNHHEEKHHVRHQEVQTVTSLNGHAPARNVFVERHRARVSAEVIWTEQETANFLRLRKSTVADMARRGDLPSIRLGRHRRFLQDDVIAYVEQQRDRPSRGF